MFLLVDNYDSFTYNLYALFRLNGQEVRIIRNDEYIDAEKYEGIIISPGPSNPLNSGTSMKYLENYTGKKPIFGVCLGMQCIGHHLGYEVSHAKSVMHGKTDTITSQDSLILGDGEFTAVRYHSLSVKCGDDRMRARAVSDGEVMAIEDHSMKLYGVQFHPESIKSERGDSMVTNFVKAAKGA
ncbi:anthranilate synthase component II [Limisalsivibrio acetivorans]|uniref:anthranilate synthase component II n=1 Tax=Limisalsivibrio acetivorans TaxID=1304888 RepID=UPI0003B62B68|nr:aminodeoxychorismate/anthranilate synthase component II [Limisalsivibrio acetivorans]